MSPFGSISLRETALAGYRPHRGRYFAVPVTAAPRRGPNGKNPALVGLHSPSISPAAKPRWPVIGPTGAAILPFPSRLRRAGAPTAKPRRLSPFGSISPARNRAGRSLPPPGATCSLPHFRFAQMWPRIFPRGLPGYVPLFHGWPRIFPRGLPGYVPLFHGWPRARTPALVAVRLHFAARNRAGRSLPPLGATCSLPHFRFAQMWPRIFPRGLPGYVPLFPGWPRARTPALVAVRLHFAARNRAGRSLPPPGATCSLPHFRFAQMWPRARTPALSSVSS